MTEQITIDKAYYDFLVEKVKEGQEHKKTAQVAQWNRDIALRGCRMNQEDWTHYYDFIKHNWYSLDEEAREAELAIAEAMSKIERDEEGYMAFAQFVNSLHDLEFYGKKENKE
jgi:hypothetical protein